MTEPATFGNFYALEFTDDGAGVWITTDSGSARLAWNDDDDISLAVDLFRDLLRQRKAEMDHRQAVAGRRASIKLVEAE